MLYSKYSKLGGKGCVTMMGFWNADKIGLSEQWCMMLLNRSNKVLAIVELPSGGVSEMMVGVKMVFCVAPKACATSILISHNYPSDDLKPSYQDIQITKKLVEAGKIMEFKVHDHLIISSEGYLSMADEGYI